MMGKLDFCCSDFFRLFFLSLSLYFPLSTIASPALCASTAHHTARMLSSSLHCLFLFPGSLCLLYSVLFSLITYQSSRVCVCVFFLCGAAIALFLFWPWPLIKSAQQYLSLSPSLSLSLSPSLLSLSLPPSFTLDFLQFVFPLALLHFPASRPL